MSCDKFLLKRHDNDLKLEQISLFNLHHEEAWADACIIAFALKPNLSAYQADQKESAG